MSWLAAECCFTLSQGEVWVITPLELITGQGNNIRVLLLSSGSKWRATVFDHCLFYLFFVFVSFVRRRRWWLTSRMRNHQESYFHRATGGGRKLCKCSAWYGTKTSPVLLCWINLWHQVTSQWWQTIQPTYLLLLSDKHELLFFFFNLSK